MVLAMLLACASNPLPESACVGAYSVVTDDSASTLNGGLSRLGGGGVPHARMPTAATAMASVTASRSPERLWSSRHRVFLIAPSLGHPRSTVPR
jgi:hypothetical protein